MNAIEITKQLMSKTGMTYRDLAHFANLGTVSNLHQMLSRKDLKVSTFVKMLEAMDYQLIVQDTNDLEEEHVVDNEEM